jgi:polyhydroxyalkanoate synthesis regulator phasin
VLDDVKTFLRAGLDSLSPGATDRVPEAVLAKAHVVAEQMSSLFGGLLEWSSEARASLRQEVKDAVNRQVGDLGVATKREVDSLRARIEELEKQVARTPAAKPSQPSTTSKPSTTTKASKATKPQRAASSTSASTRTVKSTRSSGSGPRRSPGSARGAR